MKTEDKWILFISAVVLLFDIGFVIKSDIVFIVSLAMSFSGGVEGIIRLGLK